MDVYVTAVHIRSRYVRYVPTCHGDKFSSAWVLELALIWKEWF